MDCEMWALVAEMHAALATIEGMKAFNQYRESHGDAQGYDEGCFLECGTELDRIAKRLRGM